MTPWTAAHQASLSFTVSQSLLKLMSIESVMSSNHLIICHLLLLLSSIFPSIRVCSCESALCIRWPKYWSFSLSPSNDYSGLIPSGLTDLNITAQNNTHLLSCSSGGQCLKWVLLSKNHVSAGLCSFWSFGGPSSSLSFLASRLPVFHGLWPLSS